MITGSQINGAGIKEHPRNLQNCLQLITSSQEWTDNPNFKYPMTNLNLQVLGTVPSPETLKLPSLWSPWQRPSSPSEVCTKLSEKSSISVTATNPSLSVSQNGTFDDRDGNELRRWQRWWQQWWSIIILSSLALDKGRPEDGARRLKPGWYWLRQTTVIKTLLLLLADNFQTMTSYCSALLVSSDKYIAVS